MHRTGHLRDGAELAHFVTAPNWPTSWTRAAIELCALSAIGRAGTTHGYEVARQLQSAGLGEIKGGTLYPVLSRLEEQGLTRTWWVEGAGGPGRKLIAITPKGNSELAARTAQWQAWSERVDRLLNTPPKSAGVLSDTDLINR